MFDKTSMLLRQAAAAVILISLVALTAGCASDKGSVTPAVEPPSAMADRVITDVTTRVEAGEVLVSIQGSAMLTYTSVKQSLPLGVVLYFPDATFSEAVVQPAVENAVVEKIEASQQNSATRLKILLKEDAEYEVVRSGNGLNVIFVADMGGEPVVATDTGDTPAEASVATMTVEAEETAVAPAPSDTPAVVGPGAVNQIDFTSTQSGASTILIGTTGPVGYTVSKKDDTTLYLKLSDTTLPDSRKRPIITTRFNSAVNRILPVQTEQMGGDTLFIIELRDAVPYLVTQSGDQIEVSLDPSTVPPVKEDQAKLPAWKKAITEAETMIVPSVEEADAGMAPAAAAGSTIPDEPTPSVVEEPTGPEISVGTSRNYTGEKIAVDFFETDIKNVFRIIRAVSGENFAIDKDVTGQVTMTLQNPVPWDQILDLVLKMNLLGSVKENGITRIATLETLKEEESKRLQYIAAERFSKELQKSLAPISTEYILISYSNAEADIKPHLERILTAERGSVSVDARTNQIIITDTEEKIAKAREIVGQIDRITPQVIIEARIVEASSNFTRAFGVDWNAGTDPSNGIDSGTLGGVYGYDVAMDYSVDTQNSIGINFSRLTGSTFILDAKLTALESKGTGKIVSSPKILTLDNKKATIKQGVEIPYQTVDDGDVNVEFKKVELKLEVTPHVTADDRIALQVLIDKNDVGSITDGVPGLNTKGVETELIMNDGETIVIGGIIKSNKTFNESGFPVLSKIPVLGWLFKNRTRTEEKQELLVFLTPRVVKMDELKI